YALLSSAPETDDTDFTIKRFADIVNKDLNGMLGNFVSRVCKLTEKHFGSKVPPRGQKPISPELEETINERLKDLTAALNDCEFRNAVAALRALWAAGNEFITKTAPWDLVKTDKESAGATLNECFQLIDFYTRISAPFIPGTAQKMQDIFPNPESRIPNRDLSWPEKYERRIEDGESFTVPENLFERIDDDKIAAMTSKYIS
ncbi:MAG: class I tRNA ligase family protein, partial [Rickettsiales bacterium]|nr:class I tRNA ligase family protein [Rickettsiales bacterium]